MASHRQIWCSKQLARLVSKTATSNPASLCQAAPGYQLPASTSHPSQAAGHHFCESERQTIGLVTHRNTAAIKYFLNELQYFEHDLKLDPEWVYLVSIESQPSPGTTL